MKPLPLRALEIEEVEEAGKSFKDDLVREAIRMARRHNSVGALAALEGIEYIEEFVHTLSLRAGSRLGFPARARPIRLFKKRGGAQ